MSVPVHLLYLPKTTSCKCDRQDWDSTFTIIVSLSDFPRLSSSVIFTVDKMASFFSHTLSELFIFPFLAPGPFSEFCQVVRGTQEKGEYWFQPCDAISPSFHKSAGFQEAVRRAPSDFYTCFTIKSAQGLLGCLFSQKAEAAGTHLLCRGEGFTRLEVTGDAGVEHFNFQHPFFNAIRWDNLCVYRCTYPEPLNEDPSWLFCCKPKLHLKTNKQEHWVSGPQISFISISVWLCEVQEQ